MEGLNQITVEEYQLLRALRRAGVLQDLHMGEIEPECVIGIFCADGHRFDDGYQHTKCVCGKNIHPLTKHGGALVLADDSPFAVTVRGEFAIHHDQALLADTEDAMRIKNTPHILSYAHFPCVKATSEGLTMLQVFEHHIQAKDRLRREIKGCDVRCLIHVDYLGHLKDRRRFASYFFNRERFLNWQQISHPQERREYAAD